MQYSMQYLLW